MRKLSVKTFRGMKEAGEERSFRWFQVTLYHSGGCNAKIPSQVPPGKAIPTANRNESLAAESGPQDLLYISDYYNELTN